MPRNVISSLVMSFHQCKYFPLHIRLGNQVKLGRRIGLNCSQCELALIGNQIRQQRFLLGFLEKQVRRLVLRGDLDCRMTGKRRLALQDDWLTTCRLNPLNELVL